MNKIFRFWFVVAGFYKYLNESHKYRVKVENCDSIAAVRSDNDIHRRWLINFLRIEISLSVDSPKKQLRLDSAVCGIGIIFNWQWMHVRSVCVWNAYRIVNCDMVLSSQLLFSWKPYGEEKANCWSIQLIANASKWHFRWCQTQQIPFQMNCNEVALKEHTQSTDTITSNWLLNRSRHVFDVKWE